MTDGHNAAFTLFGHSVYWYGIIITLGIFVAIAVAWRRERRLDLPTETTLDLSLIMLPAGLICARLYYVAFSWSHYAAHPLDILNIRQGGLAIYGALIGGLISLLIYARVKRVPFLLLTDLLAPAVALAQGIGRWGNFFNQEAYGVAVTNPRLQFFPVAVYIQAEGGYHFATFFYESVWCLGIGIALLALERTRRIKRVGDGFFLYVMLYAAERAVVEGLRTDSLWFGSLRASQMLSILALGAVVVLFAARLARTGRRLTGVLGLSLALLLTLAMALCSMLQLQGLPYVLLFSLLSLALGAISYAQLPNLQYSPLALPSDKE